MNKTIREIIGYMAYPVGSIYYTTKTLTKANLTSMYGGTWVQIIDKMLVGAGGNYSLGSTGGYSLQATPVHNHTYSHTHTIGGNTHCHAMSLSKNIKSGKSYSRPLTYNASGDQSYYTSYSGSHTHSFTAASGTSQSEGEVQESNYPPCLAVQMWERIS